MLAGSGGGDALLLGVRFRLRLVLSFYQGQGAAVPRERAKPACALLSV